MLRQTYHSGRLQRQLRHAVRERTDMKVRPLRRSFRGVHLGSGFGGSHLDTPAVIDEPSLDEASVEDCRPRSGSHVRLQLSDPARSPDASQATGTRWEDVARASTLDTLPTVQYTLDACAIAMFTRLMPPTASRTTLQGSR
jgi:hypothetical protein